MSKKKLLEEIVLRPARYYRQPGDVIRDRRFADADRLEILRAWENAAEESQISQIQAAIQELEHRERAAGHAAE